MRDTILGMSSLWVATAMLIATHVVIMTERLNRASVAGVGACLMIATGVIDQDTAIRCMGEQRGAKLERSVVYVLRCALKLPSLPCHCDPKHGPLSHGSSPS